MATKSKAQEERPVVVCTEYKGVFFGYATDTDADPIILKRARMCVYWSADMKGIMGLASRGPSAQCKVGDAVPEIKLNKITAVIACTEEATAAWENPKWKN